MNKHKKYQKVSPETQNDAMKSAKATQRPGQTKEQTKLISLGVEKGINHYKKQQKEKSRELSRKLQKVSKQSSLLSDSVMKETEQTLVYKQSMLPWGLLFISWAIFIVYNFL